MTISFGTLRSAATTLVGAGFWLSFQQPASAQVLVAQTGGGKTAVGWVIVLVCIALGLLVVCRPSGRKEFEGGKK